MFLSAIETQIINEIVEQVKVEDAIAIAHFEIAAISFDAETEEEADRQIEADKEAQEARWENQADWAATSF